MRKDTEDYGRKHYIYSVLVILKLGKNVRWVPLLGTTKQFFSFSFSNLPSYYPEVHQKVHQSELRPGFSVLF